MIGIEMPFTRLTVPGCPPCALPILAGAGVSAAGLAMSDWRTITSNATAAIGLAGLVGGSIVGGVIYAVTKFDQVKIERQKKYDEANKTSLSAQMAESLVNQEAMRASLHTLRNDAQMSHAENANLRDDLAILRGQFMSVSKQLYETDMSLHSTRTELHTVLDKLQKTSELLATSEKDRNTLRAELDGLRKQQTGQGERLTKLEQGGSAESYPVPPGLLDTPPGGTPIIKP